MSVPLVAYLAVGAVLFGIGVFGVLSQRGAIMILMSTEVIMNAAMLNTIAFWRFRAPNDYAGQIFALVILTIAAVEMAVGMASNGWHESRRRVVKQNQILNVISIQLRLSTTMTALLVRSRRV